MLIGILIHGDNCCMLPVVLRRLDRVVAPTTARETFCLGGICGYDLEERIQRLRGTWFVLW